MLAGNIARINNNRQPAAANRAAGCSTSYGVTFPLLAKTEVNGPGRHPRYAELTKTPDGGGEAGDVHRNFEKFLIAPADRRQPLPTADSA